MCIFEAIWNLLMLLVGAGMVLFVLVGTIWLMKLPFQYLRRR